MKCEICGKPKGPWFNHAECSKIKQEQHKHDKRQKPADNNYTERHIRGFLKRIGE